MKEDYLQDLLEFKRLCQDLRELVRTTFYKKDGSLKEEGRYGFFCFYPNYTQKFLPIKRMTDICDLLGIEYFEKWKPALDRWINCLEDPHYLVTFDDFNESLKVLENTLEGLKDEIAEIVSLLDDREIDRLNEALHCFLEGCYYASVAMSVSAIEFRLFSLMNSVCPNPELEELTLGQLIGEYLDNKQRYSNVIPKKHEPLLQHCNTYRIFSVHPKKEKINKPVASSILNMTFLFLLDKKLKREIKEEGK